MADSTKQQSSSRPWWVQLKTGSRTIQTKNSKLCVSFLLRGHAAQKLDLFVSSLRQSHASSLCTVQRERQGHASHFCIIQNLTTLPGPRVSSRPCKSRSNCACHLAQGPRHISTHACHLAPTPCQSLYHSNLTTLLDLCMADEHQFSFSRASATDKQSATSSRVSSLQMTPTHSHSSRSSSSRHSRKEVCA